jgi:hypothetical protein
MSDADARADLPDKAATNEEGSRNEARRIFSRPAVDERSALTQVLVVRPTRGHNASKKPGDATTNLAGDEPDGDLHPWWEGGNVAHNKR